MKNKIIAAAKGIQLRQTGYIVTSGIAAERLHSPRRQLGLAMQSSDRPFLQDKSADPIQLHIAEPWQTIDQHLERAQEKLAQVIARYMISTMKVTPANSEESFRLTLVMLKGSCERQLQRISETMAGQKDIQTRLLLAITDNIEEELKGFINPADEFADADAQKYFGIAIQDLYDLALIEITILAGRLAQRGE